MIRGCRPPRALWLACWLALGCRTRTNDPTTLCSEACSTLAGADAQQRAHCEETCAKTEREAQRAACIEEQRGYLRCVARHDAPSSKPAWVRLAHGEVSSQCQRAHDAFRSCMSPCNERGVVRTADRTLTWGGAERRVQAEQVGGGCDLPEKPEVQRSPAGAPCQHSSVCSSSRCACPGTQIGFLARACVDGRCTNRDEACRVVPLAVEYSGCRAKRPD